MAGQKTGAGRFSAVGYVKRYMLLLVGLLIMGFGITFSIRSDLGTTPISTVPFAVSLISPLTVGAATIAMHVVMILIQIAILGREFPPVQLLQLPVGVLLGVFIDMAMWLTREIDVPNYPVALLFGAIGIVLTGIGVGFEVVAGVVVLAGEGVVIAICRKWKLPFSRTKVINDVVLVCLAMAVSLIGLGTIEGVREGTLAGALLVGIVAAPVIKHAKPWADKTMA